VTGLLALWLVAGSELLVPAGQPAPRLEGRTLDGRPWSDSVTGEITVVEFFATWCPKCRHALADEHRLAASRQFRLIIVDVDEDPLLVQDFFTRHPPPPGAGLLIDQSGSARANWGVTGFPSVFLVDKAGIVRKRFAGWGDGMAKYVADKRPAKVLMVTECSMSDNVAAETPDVEFVRPCNLCPHMKRITLDNIHNALLTLSPRVEVEPAIAARARKAVERMLAVGR